MKTIKQLADEIGVSKTAIRKKMTEEVKTKFAETISGVIYIDEQGETLIKQAFNQFEPQTQVSDVSANQFAVVSGQVSSEFASVLEALQRQLDIKDKQISDQQQSIKELTAALENSTSSLKSAHALHAGTMKQNFETLPPGDDSAHIQKPEKKEVFIKRIFKKTKI